MVDFLDSMRYWGTKRNKILSFFKYYQIVNRLSQLLADLLLPYYFKITAGKHVLTPENIPQGRVIVSMTTFPVRLPKVYLAVESLLHQSVKPDKIVLYLTRSQVPNIESCPENLKKLQARGLEIRLCDKPIRSHTKYYDAFHDFPEDIVITADDDIIYRSDFVSTLLEFHKKHPFSIICNWAKRIKNNSEGKSIYAQWPEAGRKNIDVEKENYSIFGVGGVLYPPNCLYKDWDNSDMIVDLCLTADDIWLSCMAFLAGTSFVFTGYKQNHLPVTIRNNETLIEGNYVRNQICVDNLNAYYLKELGFEPFVKAGNIQ